MQSSPVSYRCTLAAAAAAWCLCAVCHQRTVFHSAYTADHSRSPVVQWRISCDTEDCESLRSRSSLWVASVSAFVKIDGVFDAVIRREFATVTRSPAGVTAAVVAWCDVPCNIVIPLGLNNGRYFWDHAATDS